jgi:anti-sigma B factor antagonist
MITCVKIRVSVDEPAAILGLARARLSRHPRDPARGLLEVTAVAGTDPVTPAPAKPVVVTLPAEIDIANADAVGEQLAAALAPGVTVVIADMTATTFCDSRGVRMLVLAQRQAVANGAELRLLLPNPRVMRVWRILGLEMVLPVYQSLEEALAP